MMSPSMPSGSVLDHEAWEAVAGLCRERDLLLDVRLLGHSADEASERLFRIGRVAATPMTNWGSERAGDYVRFVFANESCERLRGFGGRVRSSLT